MLDPTAVSTDMGTFSGNINNVINQNGQIAAYISGVTDFATYTGSVKATPGIANNLWTSACCNTTGSVDFTLGGSYAIDSVAVWGLLSDNADNIASFTLLASDDPSFTTTTTIGSFVTNFLRRVADTRHRRQLHTDHSVLRSDGDHEQQRRP